jgi:predicted nuclease of predicted toxin-antitoxin system
VRFKVDENLPLEVVELLRADGHDAASMLEQKMGGERDPNVAEVCRNEGRILVTLDTDFADIQEYPPAEYPGIVVFRLGQQGKRHILTVAKRWASLLGTEEVSGRLWVVDEVRVRIHE